MRAKAFDNRLGCAASIEVLKAVRDEKIEVSFLSGSTK